jgi:hypothetical protein
MNDHPVLQVRMIRRLLCAKIYKRLLISNGTGLTAGFRLVGNHGAAQTVFNDNDVDVLTGSQGIDWFFANRYADDGGVLDIITDKAANELWSDTDF